MAISASLGEQHEVALDHGTLRYRERGQGPAIVFVHGLLVNGDLWRNVVPVLAGESRCITPDLPLGSHAPPARADADLTPPGLARLVAGFLAALDLDEVTLVGNDTGGAICQLVATRHPERIGRLVLTPCDAFDNFLPPLFKPLQLLARVPGSVFAVGQVMRSRRLQRLPIGFGWLAKRGFPDEIAASYLEPARSSREVRRDVTKALRGINSRYTEQAAEDLRDFRKPALLAWATEDRVFPLEHGRRLAEILPNARLETIDDSYSFVPEDQPERLAELIRAFAGPTV